MSQVKTSSSRLQYLDWVRGVGAIIMLQGHVFDSFTRPDLRPGEPWVMSQFVGGMPPALFLFLTGVTFAFLMDSSQRKGLGLWDRFVTALGRSKYLFLVAFLFRLQLFIFGFPAEWQGLFRVDILNCMGFSMAVVAFLAMFSTRTRTWLCVVLGFAIAFAAPLLNLLPTSCIPWMLRNYVVPNFGSFSFFPWGSYLVFGLAMGSLIRLARTDWDGQLIKGAALAGGSLILAGQFFAQSKFTLYANSNFWLNSPLQVMIKLGVVLLLISVAYFWTYYGAGPGWSWVRQFGTTSLLVYWVHIELVYGHALWFLKGSLNVPQTVAAAAGIILLMLALSIIRTNWDRVRAVLDELGWELAPKTERAGAD